MKIAPLLLLLVHTSASQICNLCFNGEPPGKPYTITAVLYLPGNPTCKELYDMGQEGKIDQAICYPLQLYMQKPCGCDLTTDSSATTQTSSSATIQTSKPTQVTTAEPTTDPTTATQTSSSATIQTSKPSQVTTTKISLSPTSTVSNPRTEVQPKKGKKHYRKKHIRPISY